MEVCDLLDPITHIALQIKHNTVWGVSDGSLIEENTTSGWIIKAGQTELIRGGNIVSGAHTDSTWAELARLYSMISIIHIISKIHNITQGQIILGSDSDGALEKTKHPHPDPDCTHYDLVQAATNLM